MPRRNHMKEMKIIQKQLDKMKPGQMKHVRVGPGRSGMVTIKKGPGGKVGSPKLLQGMPRKRAKVIRRKGY